jgi:hypothetical protein
MIRGGSARQMPRIEPCPICAEWRYISIVKVCPICGAPGKLQEVKDTAEAYLRRLEFQRVWETGTFEQIWDAITPPEIE